MRISFSTNIEVLRGNRLLSQTGNRLSDAFQALSSGIRIVSGADQSLASILNSDSRIASTAIRNASDGLSISTTAIESINQSIQILSRMQELATASANGTLTARLRSALSTEFVLLSDEVDRIASTTSFNGTQLLSNSSAIYIQVGLRGTGSESSIIIPQTVSTLESIGLRSGLTLTVSISALTEYASQQSAEAALLTVQNAIETLGQRSSSLSAATNRLQSAVNSISAARENLAGASSKITDVETAEQITELLKLQILQNAQTALKAQANEQSALVLKLLPE